MQWVWTLLEWLAELAVARWVAPTGEITAWACLAVATALFLFAGHWRTRLLGLVFLVPVLVPARSAPPPGGVWLDLLDVGQGLAAVVRTSHHVLVYDTGPRYPSGFNTGDAVLVPFLRGAGIGAVDRLIISHGDNDHIGGAHALDEQVPVFKVLTSVPERVPWRASRHCLRGQTWVWDGVLFEMLAPGDELAAGNNGSCVLRIRAGEQQVLLPGDIEKEAEAWLVKNEGEQLSSTILVAPHHGSNTSSTPAFIEAVQPRYVLFPTGYRNRWEFPRPQVTARYRERGAQLLTTADAGAIRVVLQAGHPVRVSRYRLTAQRYWHRPL